MAVLDLETFLQERLRSFDENLDLSPGSPVDIEVIQPTLRRMGTDPFTVDVATFVTTRLQQAFPELAITEGDALTDLLVKPTVLLMDPLVREVYRVRQQQSFADPATLTTAEAEALGANIFTNREKGAFARGQVRMYFDQPRGIQVSPTNFFSSRGGLHFFPDGVQAITLEEMLLNTEGALYYFDVNVIAENPGTAYNVAAGEIVTVANVESAVRVTNLRRVRSGESEETAVEYIGRTGQELTERSMVTIRGIGARVTRAFPEVTRLAVVGFGDPEMQRDVVRGGGLGGIRAAGVLGAGAADGANQLASRRFTALDADVDFTLTVGPIGPLAPGVVATLFGAFGGVPPLVRDLNVRAVVNATTLEFEDQVVNPLATQVSWVLRRRELTLSDIPGGLLFPETDFGEAVVEDGAIHVGGAHDIHVRGSQLDSSSLVIDNLQDSEPALSGAVLSFSAVGQVSLDDLVLGVDYAIGDSTFQVLEEAKSVGFTVTVVDGPNAGNYRVIGVTQLTGASPILTLDTAVPVVSGSYLWRLVDTIQMDLADPRETRVTGNDLVTTQNVDLLTTVGGTDFNALGVSVGDVVRVTNGLDAGDYTVLAVPSPAQLRVDRTLMATRASVSYEVFRANAGGGLDLPLLRITSVELLDSSGQPVGTTIPYALPVDIQSQAFQNPGRGVKVSVTDARLGAVSNKFGAGLNFGAGRALTFTFPVTGVSSFFVNLSGVLTAAQAAAAINAAASVFSGAALAVVLDTDRVGIVPLGGYTELTGTAVEVLWGNGSTFASTADFRSEDVDANQGGWSNISPDINQDNLDVAQVLDGNQIGFYGSLAYELPAYAYTGLYSGDFATRNGAALAPEVGRQLEVGARSIGSARVYFLEPTSVEFGPGSFFSATLANGGTVRFFPDPTFESTRIPAAPTTVLPKSGAVAGTSVFDDTTQDFVLSNVLPGDVLQVLYVPIVGAALPDPVPGLALKDLYISVSGRADQRIVFVNDLVGDPNAVSRAGVVSQINAALGSRLAALGSGNELEFEGDVALVVRGNGTANSLLGLPLVAVSNTAPQAGRYRVLDVAPTQLTLPVASFGVVSTQRVAYRILRPAAQRIGSTAMSAQVAEASLHYMDVELVSEGTGDLWNIEAGEQLTVTGFRSDGYYVTTDDSNLTFSELERPKLHVSRSILEVGVSDDPANATQLTGQNIEVTYDRSTLVSDVQNFALSETERVVCASPLARHLIPHFVRYDFNYEGGSRADVVLRDHETYIRNRFPADQLESSDLQELAYRRGAVSVQNPVSLIAIVHNVDRTVTAQRSQDSLNTGRLAAFIPDVLNINRSSG